MRKSKIIISNRLAGARYLAYRSTDIADVMSASITDTPSATIEAESPDSYFVDNEAHGLAAPKISYFVEGNEITVTASENKGLVYYYNIIAEKDGEQASKPAMISNYVRQQNETIVNRVRGEAGNEIKWFSDSAKLDLSDFVGTVVPMFSTGDVIFDTDRVIINSEIIINLPNIWYDIDKTYNYRPYLPFYVYATIPGYQSLPTTVRYSESNAYIPIDKIEVLRKEVTGTPDLFPLTADEDGVECLNSLVRKDGRYYSNEYASIPMNSVNRFGSVSVFNEEGYGRVISIKNKCSAQKDYKYTFYAYDCFGVRSAPVVFNINT